MDSSRLKTRLIAKEGQKLEAYQDSLGFWTICVGHLLGFRPIPPVATQQQCDCWLEEDIQAAERQAIQLPFYAGLDSVRQNVIVELFFNLSHRLLAFKKFLAAMAAGDYATAGQELKDSLAYKQEPHRFDELISALNSGAYP